MSPTPPSTTQRYRISYTGPFASHKMTFHGLLTASRASFLSDVQGVVDAMPPLVYTGTLFDGAEYAAAGSDLFFPDSDWVTPTAGSGGVQGPMSSPATFLQWGGRDTVTGVRVKLYLYETVAQPNPKMRYLAGDVADIDAVVAELSSPTSSIATVAGTAVSWKTYANVGENDFLTHKARR